VERGDGKREPRLVNECEGLALGELGSAASGQPQALHGTSPSRSGYRVGTAICDFLTSYSHQHLCIR